MNKADTLEEKRVFYSEIMNYKKDIFDNKKKYLEIIPIISDNFTYSTLVFDYNPIKENEKNLDNIDLNLGENVHLEEMENLD
jgi:hypothetical protein